MLSKYMVLKSSGVNPMGKHRAWLGAQIQAL